MKKKIQTNASTYPTLSLNVFNQAIGEWLQKDLATELSAMTKTYGQVHWHKTHF